MELPLEAHSLSTITQLAGNPPKFPRSPYEKKRQPLVLYIARVPGKKDIILTTMKPRLKNLTAEDVMNSLYYLHLDLPSDALVLKEIQKMEDIENIRGMPKNHEATGQSLHVEQLPELPPEFDRQLRIGPEALNALHPSGKKTEILKSASEESRVPPPSRLVPTVEASPVRRPLGPRPIMPQLQINTQPFPGGKNIPFRHNDLSAISTTDLKTKPSESGISRWHELQSDGQSQVQCLEHGPISDNSQARNPFSITFIRRDPTSAAQWNVGKIKANPLPVRLSSNVQPKPVLDRRRSSTLVCLTTEGYRQFRTCPVNYHTDEESRNQQSLPTPLDAQFKREVRLAALDFWGRKSREHRKSLSDQSTIRKNFHTSDSLENSRLKYEELNQSNCNSLFEDPECGFLSPWNGRCEFSTGNSGRTLKCKHALPNSASAINVSELRFNLPSVINLSGTSKSLASLPVSEAKGFAISKSDVKSSLFPKSRTSRTRSQPPPPTSYAALYPSSDDDDNDARGRKSLDDRVDPLGLGREKAGGGIRGKRAKLGKLIVYDEGLKMLDLVVAANMGVWWTIWEKSS